jgi:hypothetical protein
MAKKSTEKIKEIAKEVTQKTEPVIDEIMTKAEPVIDGIKTKAEPIIGGIMEKADPAIQLVKDTTARFYCKEEIFVQYNNHEARTSDIMDRCKSDYLSKGHQENDIKEIQIYIKPVDNAVYYVVNNTDTGKLEF